jgi:D-serine deaminase-like pyridoxal phosphate-dependent protein
MTNIRELETPALLLDPKLLDQNLARMRDHLASLRVTLRPHVKTAKCIEVVRLTLEGQPGGITVSTLKEAEYFFEHGIRDILYAVGIAPNKLAHAAALIRGGADLTLILDSAGAAQAVAEAAYRERVTFPVLIELDVDDHRAGIAPDGDALLAVARQLTQSEGVEFRGVMTHAGDSYSCRSREALRAMAEQERARSVHAAERLRAAGIPVQVVSVGSTPTATFADDLTGVTEVRAGVYVFQDLVMAGIGVCRTDDIALSVLVSVIGHQPDRGWIITDGGWTALSRDRGTSSQPLDQGYGLVRDSAGQEPLQDLIVISVNQEHGIIARRDGGKINPATYPIGTLLRVLPNHACATAAQHARYEVVEGVSGDILATWQRINGW